MPNQQYSKINLLLRAILFNIISCVMIVLYSLVCVVMVILPIEYRHKLIRNFLSTYLYLLKKICYVNYHIEGRENIPKNRVGVVLSKHQSTWETFYLPLLFHTPAVILKRELLWIPFFGWGLAASDPISINRKNKTSAMSQIIAKGKKCLAAGRWILVYPEGTRVPAGRVGQYKLGGPRLAVAAECPVIPIAHNAGRFWPRRQLIKRPGTIRLVVGPVIETTNRTPEEVLELTKQWIEETVRRIDVPV